MALFVWARGTLHGPKRQGRAGRKLLRVRRPRARRLAPPGLALSERTRVAPGGPATIPRRSFARCCQSARRLEKEGSLWAKPHRWTQVLPTLAPAPHRARRGRQRQRRLQPGGGAPHEHADDRAHRRAPDARRGLLRHCRVRVLDADALHGATIAGQLEPRAVKSFPCHPVYFVWIITNEIHRGA